MGNRQLFDHTLAVWRGERPALCPLQPTYGYGRVVEQSGDVYSCDHYVEAEHRRVSCYSRPPAKLIVAKVRRRFGQQKAQ